MDNDQLPGDSVDPSSDAALDPDAEAAEELTPVEKLLNRERFSQARFDVGYERPDVDALVAALRSSYIEEGNFDGVIESHTLHTAGFREGYEITEFEAWLKALITESGTQIGERPAVVANGRAPRSSDEIRASKRAKPETGLPSAITEKRSLLDRFRGK
jgi:hypothetical protein